MVSISCSVCAIQIFCIYGEVCVKILCSEKELLNLNDSNLIQNFYGNKTGFVRPGHIFRISNSTMEDQPHQSLSTKFYGVRSCVHAQKTIPLAPIYSFTSSYYYLLATVAYNQLGLGNIPTF